MSTIATLLTGDSGSSSLGNINDNFAALNTDKIENDSTDTLTNKTIDADGTGNSITNLATADTATAAKTGVDTKFVTGTKGTSGNVSQWNVDGDLVGSGIAFTTTAPTLTSTDATAPTSQAVQEAITAQLLTKEMWVLVAGGDTVTSAYDTALGDFVVNSPDAGQNVYFNFKIPDNFTTLTSASVVMIPDATETIQYDLTSDYGQVGEAYTTHSESSLNVTDAGATASQLLEADVSAVLTFLTAGDYVGLKLNSDTTQLRIIGLSLIYT